MDKAIFLVVPALAVTYGGSPGAILLGSEERVHCFTQ